MSSPHTSEFNYHFLYIYVPHNLEIVHYSCVISRLHKFAHCSWYTKWLANCSKTFRCSSIHSITVLSRASPHGCSQLKCQKLRVGGCTEEVLKWFNYPHARAHPRCKVGCQGVPNVCKPLMPDVVSPKVHQNNHSYVSSADLPSDIHHIRK